MIQYQTNDLPAACCGRCFWWVLIHGTEVGQGKCACAQKLTRRENAPCADYVFQTIESCGTPR